MTEQISQTDLHILSILQKDASLSSAEIAEQINLSPSPCWRRINKLEQGGYIRKRVALLDPEKLNLGVIVFASVTLANNDEPSLEEFETIISSYDEVVECYTVTGTMDYLLKIVTRDIKHFEKFLRKHLLHMPLVREVHSNVAVTQIKYTTELPLRV